MASGVYNLFKQNLLRGQNLVDMDGDTLKVMLVTSTYTPNFDTHDFVNDVSANEVSGTGYTAGGATLASVTTTLDTTNDWAYVDAADTSWTTSTITARAAVIYKDTGNTATSPLICYIDFGSDQTSTAGTFLITWSATGFLKIA